MIGARCPNCTHSWTAHGIEARGLTRRAFCWVANCDCTMEAPERQKTIQSEAATT